MALKDQIKSLLRGLGRKVSMSEIYSHFPDAKKTTVRGRVYDNLGKGISRVDRNLYISSEAIVEIGNTLEIIDRLVDEGDVFDLVFLDIPYQAAGTKGGKRDLFELGTISPDEFGQFMRKLKEVLNGPDAKVVFMFTSGSSSKRQHDKYLSKVVGTGLVQCGFGHYTKLWPNGRRMNIGKYLMPRENIYVFSESGASVDCDLIFEEVPDLREYPTAKPYRMVEFIVDKLSNVGDWVLDPFCGSGKVLKACLELNRKCHAIDSNQASFDMMLRMFA